jgi:hypothetical protein
VRKRSVSPVSNWRRPLPRPIVLPEIPLTLSTIADVRDSVNKRLPPSYREKQTWSRVSSVASAAARGQLPADDVAVALKMVLQLEGIRCS